MCNAYAIEIAKNNCLNLPPQLGVTAKFIKFDTLRKDIQLMNSSILWLKRGGIFEKINQVELFQRAIYGYTDLQNLYFQKKYTNNFMRVSTGALLVGQISGIKDSLNFEITFKK